MEVPLTPSLTALHRKGQTAWEAEPVCSSEGLKHLIFLLSLKCSGGLALKHKDLELPVENLN